MAVVKIGAGQSIQAMIDANPTGTVFQLDAGVYRQSNIKPKDFQKFIGSGNTVINGSIELKGWTQQGGVWKVGGLPNPLPQDPLAAGHEGVGLRPRGRGAAALDEPARVGGGAAPARPAPR